MGRTHNVWYQLPLYTGLWLAVSYTGPTSFGASPQGPQAIQWAMLQGTIDCQQEQVLALGDTLRDLLDQTQHHYQNGNINQALDRFDQAIATLQQLPTNEAKLGGLVTLLSPPAGNQPNFIESLSQSFNNRENKAHFQQLVTQLGQVIDSLDVGYSARKSDYWIKVALIYHNLDQADLASAALQQATLATTSIADDTIKANALIAQAQSYLTLAQPTQAKGLLQQATPLVQAIENDQHRQTALSNLATVLAQTGQREQAIEAAQAIANNDYRYSITLQAIVAHDLSQGDLEAALSLVNQISSPSYRITALSQTGLTFWQTGQLDKARTLFDQAISLANTTDHREADLAKVLEYSAQAFPDQALPLVQTLENPDLKTDLLAQLALIYHHQGNSDTAAEVAQLTTTAIQEIPESWQQFTSEHLIETVLDEKAYGLAFAYAEGFSQGANNYGQVSSLKGIAQTATQEGRFDIALQAVAALENSQWVSRLEALTAIAEAHLAAGNLDQAIALVNDFADNDFADTELSEQENQINLSLPRTLAKALYAGGHTDQADQMRDRAYQPINQISDPEAKSRALGYFLELPLTPEWEQTIFDEIETTLRQISDPWLRNNVLELTAEHLVRAQQYETAATLSQLITDDYTRQSQIDNIVETAILMEDYEIAHQFLQRLEIPEDKTRWLLKLSDRYRQQSQPSQALTVLKEAQDIAQNIADPESRQLIFGIDGGTVIEDDTDRASQLEFIALRYAQLDQPTEARATLGLIEDSTLRQHLLQKIGCWQ